MGEQKSFSYHVWFSFRRKGYPAHCEHNLSSKGVFLKVGFNILFCVQFSAFFSHEPYLLTAFCHSTQIILENAL